MVNAGPAARNSTGFVPLVPAPPIAVPTVKKGDSAVTEVSTDKLLNRPGLPAGASVIAADAHVSRLPLPAAEIAAMRTDLEQVGLLARVAKRATA